MPSWAAWCLRKAGLDANCAPRTSHSPWSERVFALKVQKLRAKSWPSHSSSSPSMLISAAGRGEDRGGREWPPLGADIPANRAPGGLRASWAFSSPPRASSSTGGTWQVKTSAAPTGPRGACADVAVARLARGRGSSSLRASCSTSGTGQVRTSAAPTGPRGACVDVAVARLDVKPPK
eukprot:3958613-Heterocapsa_arctica.AAC.1